MASQTDPLTGLHNRRYLTGLIPADLAFYDREHARSGNADHALTLYLLKQAGADAQKVQFATMGVNLLEALRQGQIDAGVVQEPALTLLKRVNARVLVETRTNSVVVPSGAVQRGPNGLFEVAQISAKRSPTSTG